MFLIGEFSQIARVSRRMLYYYEEEGLLAPAHIDQATGYRYYSASQIPRINQILALKKLGLTLKQIQRMLDKNISTDEIRGMLEMKKAQLEQQVEDELAQIDEIEAHLQQIDVDGLLDNYDIILKPVAEQPALMVRNVFAEMTDFREAIMGVIETMPSKVDKNKLKHLNIIWCSDAYDTENIDAQIGYTLNSPATENVVCGAYTLEPTTLPAIESVASTTRINPSSAPGIYFQQLGSWIETHNYKITGSYREVFLELKLGADPEVVIDVQFPVKKILSSGDKPLLN